MWNGTEDEQDGNYSEKRQGTGPPDTQTSVYPACLAALENNGTVPEVTAVLVGPDGPVTAPSIIHTETVAAPAGSGTILYGCTATTIDGGTAACTGSMIPLTTLFPTTTTSTDHPLPSFGHPPECKNQDTFSLNETCVEQCSGGYCEQYNPGKMVKGRCVGCGPGGLAPEWRCFCKITVIHG